MIAKLSSLSIGALGALASGCITVSRKPAYTFVADNVLLQVVEEKYSAFFSVFGKKNYSGMGGTVAEADLFRNEPFRGMKSILKGFMKVSGSSLQNDAKELFAIIERLGTDMDKLEYGSENEKMDKLIAEFELRVNSARLTNLNLTEMFTTLKSRHTAFKEMYFIQTGANAELRKMETAISLRGGLAEALRGYLAMVKALKSMDGWSSLDAELNELVKAANNTVTKPGSKDDSTDTASEK